MGWIASEAFIAMVKLDGLILPSEVSEVPPVKSVGVWLPFLFMPAGICQTRLYRLSAV